MLADGLLAELQRGRISLVQVDGFAQSNAAAAHCRDEHGPNCSDAKLIHFLGKPRNSFTFH